MAKKYSFKINITGILEEIDGDIMPKAFPGAEGFGANSVGGRGGTVYEVTNTDDSGSGSFREAVEASGARTVVFRTGGTITLTSKLQVTNPYITIAGQTAPGGGICLKGSGTWNGSCLSIETHNVIGRYIRVRQGAMTNTANSRDGILIGSATPGAVHDVIVDHCSISWATDENVTIWYDPYDVTVQWCIISEGLKSSTHTSGDHSMGILVGGTGVTNVSLHHNLIAHNDNRSPRFSYEGTHDFVNNVIYNPGAEIGSFKNDSGDLLVNYVNNYIRRGGDSDGSSYELAFASPVGDNTYIFYVNGNIGPNRATDDLAENLVVLPAYRTYVTTTRNTAPAITTVSAFEALDRVLEDAGANKTVDSYGSFSNNRDSVDARIVADVTAVTGSIIDDPSDVGGWPTLAAGTAATDTDSDGMPDDWERENGLDPSDATDNILLRKDGYENLEGYFNPTFIVVQTTSNLLNSIRAQHIDSGRFGTVQSDKSGPYSK